MYNEDEMIGGLGVVAMCGIIGLMIGTAVGLVKIVLKLFPPLMFVIWFGIAGLVLGFAGWVFVYLVPVLSKKFEKMGKERARKEEEKEREKREKEAKREMKRVEFNRQKNGEVRGDSF